jgi:hypothetical protein
VENISQFDLNASLGHWLDRLAQSPHFRNENVAEMESHVRDSMTKLQSQGLAEEESFLIAIRRVGSVGKLEPEFAKVNRSWLNLIVHGFILIFFSVVCWFVWGTLHLPQMMQGILAKAGAIDQATGYGALPRFTQMMVELRNFMFVPPLLAFVYCLYLWVRKSNGKNSWTGFFAMTTAVLIFILLPTLVAVLLPVIDFMNHLPKKFLQP